MIEWDVMLNESAFAAVMAGEYSRFLRPVREGLIVFLKALPARRQMEVLADQMQLPITAGIAQRLATLAKSCPVLHKLGQILARDQRLSSDLRFHLRLLECFESTVSMDAIRDVITNELGTPESLGIQLGERPLAEASVAVVVPFTTNGEMDRGLGATAVGNGVLKILKPGIEERLAIELEILGQVGVYLDERCEHLGIPRLEYEEAFEQIRVKLAREVRLDEEQQNLTEAARTFRDEPRVHIPQLLDFCSPKITAMERIFGDKVTDGPFADESTRAEMANLVVQSLVCHPIFSRDSMAMFHSDPHAGNLLLTREQRLSILDWSLVGRLGERERVGIVQIMMGAVTLDAKKMVRELAALDIRGKVNLVSLAEIVGTRLRELRRGQFLGLLWLTTLLDESAQRAHVRFPADLLLFRKSLHTLEGVVTEIGNRTNVDVSASEHCATDGLARMDGVMVAEFMRQFIRDWPQRWMSLPQSREFSTRLSNFDMVRPFWTLPMTMTRFWYGEGADLLSSIAR